MIFEQIKEQLSTLQNLLHQLTYTQYTYNSKHLGNYSIASHTRHIIELLQCALIGYNCNSIDYINRSRDMQLETDQQFAIDSISSIITNLLKEDKLVQLVTETANGACGKTITTTYYREIVYNTEHTIHHLALIKVALYEMNLNIVDHNFGMAYATIQYNNTKVIS
jgi:hypothetical protein